jgi:AcrR family transcriptional regulator
MNHRPTTDEERTLFMPKIVTEADRAQKRQAILDVAAAEIARYGYDRANINTIAEHAGIGRGTIYLYFDSKDEVFGALLDTIGKAIDDIIQECLTLDLPWPARLQWLAEQFVALAENHSDYFRVQLSALHGVNRALSAPMARWLGVSIGRLSQALEEASAQGIIAALPAETLATLILGSLDTFVLLPGDLHQEADLSDRAHILARVLWHGLAPDQ